MSKQFILAKLKLLPFFIYLIVLALASWAFALRMDYRTQGSYRLERAKAIQSNWGKNLYQESPSINAAPKETSSSVMYADTKVALPESQTGQIETKNVRIIKSDVDVNLKMDYRRKGLTYFPTYVTAFKAVYIIKNEAEQEVTASLQLPLPAEESLVWNVEILANGSNEGSTVNSEALSWNGDMYAGEEKEIVVSYAARGLDDFSYSLAKTQGLQDFSLDIEIDGADRIDFPQGALSPSTIVEENNGQYRHLTWQFDKVLASPNVTVTLFAKQNISEHVAKLFWYAPFILIAYLVSIYGFLFIKGKSLSLFDYALLSSLYAVFYPFLAYLVSVYDQFTIIDGLRISFVVITVISLYLYQYLLGWQFALSKGLILQIAFLAFFPFALMSPQLTGFLAVIGMIVILAIVVQLRRGYQSISPRVKEKK